jgi:hypothetical protein
VGIIPSQPPQAANTILPIVQMADPIPVILTLQFQQRPPQDQLQIMMIFVA